MSAPKKDKKIFVKRNEKTKSLIKEIKIPKPAKQNKPKYQNQK